MTWQMYGKEKFNEGKEEGREEGRAENQRETIERMILKKKYDLNEIAELVDVSVEVVKEIQAALSTVK